MKVKLVVECGVDRIFAMGFSVDNTMNVNLVAVVHSCLSPMIGACQSLATTAQEWTLLELNTHTEITTLTDRMSSCLLCLLNQKRKSLMRRLSNGRQKLRKR